MQSGEKKPRYRIVYSMINGKVGMATVMTNCSALITVTSGQILSIFLPTSVSGLGYKHIISILRKNI